VLSYWIEEYHIDGYRFDLSKGFTQKRTYDIGSWSAYDQDRVDILTKYANHIRSVKSDAIIILEHLGDYWEEESLVKAGMFPWKKMTEPFSQLSMGWANNCDITGSYTCNHIVFMESHDEERIAFKIMQYGNATADYSARDFKNVTERINMLSTLFYTVPGPKMLWQFGELAYDYSINQNRNRNEFHDKYRTGGKPVRWDYLDVPERRRLFDKVSKLINFHKSHQAMEHPDVFYIGSKDGDNNSLLKWVYCKKGDDGYVAIANADVVTHFLTVPFPSNGMYCELFSDAKINVVNKDWRFRLAPGAHAVFYKTRT
jgi:1,4-alpha-glucan branching enzyme